ncbi:uncharacterized protein TrAFT101_004907 [Trichoderma asperellum]|uniref:Heterokaryon incompatibility domain-containing protein n=1 Tax=Trichoderma asperellum (strain ATCC 204424 / CBS 433.97 / NBRC 101777) TaxID=1042311 RepID=A0A2T3Z5E9_TRIA4|nr:hypothetical protein M441DRAFT_37931 [Trichoderma asperellum CBS 433.97]PTB40048.1 hypothetical protein M441DRAFT_37931 [Trichoderma asperellum CBS 433.97]UKZ89870.1 hypothetical protein TrAFT101_004907 [Trichoderma asperellum]
MRLPRCVRGHGRLPVSLTLHSRHDILGDRLRRLSYSDVESSKAVPGVIPHGRVAQPHSHLLYSRHGKKPVKRRGFKLRPLFMDSNPCRPPEKPHGNSKEKRFVYKPLSDNHSVRFLVLQPGSGSDPLVGSLQFGSLDSEDIEQLPPYEAISYVWGSGSRQYELICDGAVLPLTQSIHDALNRVRLPDRPRRLWADQVCINQDDIPERSQQVKLMNLVYRNAKRVLVWLGRDPDGVAEEAGQTIRYLDGVFKDEKAHEEFKLAHEENLSLQSSEPWVPLAKLTKLPWFQRIWIVQEIGTDAPATLYWGDTEMDWDTLSHVAAILNERYYHLRTRFLLNTSSIRYLHKRFVEPDTEYDHDHNRGNFAYELHRARHLLGNDPRDHIYAFLGHFSISKAGKELQSLTVDYSKSVKDIYIDVAVRALRGAKDLVTLSAAHHGQPLMKRRAAWTSEDLGLPSWAPDWRHLPIHILGSPTVPHRASGDTKPDLTIDEDTRVMRIRGVRVDVVERISWTIYGSAFQVRQDDAREKKKKGGGGERKRRNWGGSNGSNDLDKGDHGEDGFAQPQGDDTTTRAPSRNNNWHHDEQGVQQKGRPPPLHRRRTQLDQNGPRTHVMEVLWRRICGYRTFNLNLVYPPFLKNPPAAKYHQPSSSHSSPTPPHDHRRSAFFAFIQTLTNACTGIDRSRPYSSIPSEEWLTSAAAYLVRYAVPSSSSSSSPPSTALSPSQTFPSYPARSPGSPDSTSSISTMSSFYERANSMSSSSSSRSATPIHAAIHALSLTGDPFKWSHEAVLVTRYRRFAVTRRGYFVLGSNALQAGDVVAVLRGGKVPFVLRKVSAGGDNERWVLIGECYAHGLMDGEGWDVEGVEEEVFAVQ